MMQAIEWLLGSGRVGMKCLVSAGFFFFFFFFFSTTAATQSHLWERFAGRGETRYIDESIRSDSWGGGGVKQGRADRKL
ncbi:hypothetical protein FN846DRAFT_930083 [Sphaerosporella brunnea]|uniref:Uncharacterized protein n=1 Tax=Sphaerosporella brunnea TaxID=1250544 RepID=A0A5J5F8C3_9PEZI|nr:hypothetical protein FN846DRAFT_930072 [Sphaerosporella brunnea]KAA8913428.1 hypothetical protein FN846DRAFT_930083 [Sphaerosporella brunnea]